MAAQPIPPGKVVSGKPGDVLCRRCGRSFSPRFRFQTTKEDGRVVHYCSQVCSDPAFSGNEVLCSGCGVAFTPTLAKQVSEGPNGHHQYYCTDACRTQGMPQTEEPADETARVIAVLNQKGGTGKTITAVNLAAGLARLGERTLLVDLDPQGNVGVSLDIKAARTMYHLLIEGLAPNACAQRGRENLDVIVADEGLAAAEIALARAEPADRSMRLARAMASLHGYSYVVLDCAPALSLLNHNALSYAGEVLIPVSCDYLALVGVKQVMRSVRRVGELTGNPVTVAGVLPTFYDVRNRVCGEVLGFLRKSFGPRTLPPVRVNTRLAEAPSHKRTIFEHAPESHGARDYIRVVEWLRTGHKHSSTTRAA